MNDRAALSGSNVSDGRGAPQAAPIQEVLDAPRGRATTYGMSLGDTFHGALDREGDRDWVAIELTAGTVYDFALYGVGERSLEDPHLRLHGANGRLVDEDDDISNGNLNSLLSFTADRSGTYYLSAGAFDDAGEGDYALQVTTSASLDELADYLTDGYWEDIGESRRSFDTSVSNEITVDLTELTSEGRQLARWALEAWETVADVTFREAGGGGAHIRFYDDPGAAESYSDTTGGPIPFSTVNVPEEWLTSDGTTIDSFSFTAYLHEIGHHALGLGHLGPYNGSAEYGEDNVFASDSWQASVMSYLSQDDNAVVDADWAPPVSAMLADIGAIQDLYGAPGAASATAGDTVYGTDATIGGYLGALFGALFDGGATEGVYAGGHIALTLYDRDGVDTIDLSTSVTRDRLDLRPTRFSDIEGLSGNLGIARGTLIENAVGGMRKDRITGNDVGNELHGGAGGDLLKGLGGQDLLRGNGAGDRLLGGSGGDALFGGAGADKLRGGGGDDRAGGGADDDEVSGGAGADTFVFRLGHGRDRVRDFDPSEGDQLQLDNDLWTGDLSEGGHRHLWVNQPQRRSEAEFRWGRPHRVRRSQPADG